MPKTCWEPTDVDISNWPPTARFFETSLPDSDPAKYFVVDADTATPPPWITTVIRRRTAVLYCGPRGQITDLNADLEFPPQTTAEEAIEQMGYTLVPPPFTPAQGSTGPAEGATA